MNAVASPLRGYESLEQVKKDFPESKVKSVIDKGIFGIFDCQNHANLRKFDSRQAQVIGVVTNGKSSETILFVRFTRQTRGDEQTPDTIFGFKPSDFKNTSQLNAELKVW